VKQNAFNLEQCHQVGDKRNHSMNSDQHRAYIAAIKLHGRYFGFGFNAKTWSKGRSSRASLKIMQESLDPDFAVWNATVPEAHRVVVGSSVVQPEIAPTPHRRADKPLNNFGELK
jgi:hypothetical protein